MYVLVQSVHDVRYRAYRVYLLPTLVLGQALSAVACTIRTVGLEGVHSRADRGSREAKMQSPAAQVGILRQDMAIQMGVYGRRSSQPQERRGGRWRVAAWILINETWARPMRACLFGPGRETGQAVTEPGRTE